MAQMAVKVERRSQFHPLDEEQREQSSAEGWLSPEQTEVIALVNWL